LTAQTDAFGETDYIRRGRVSDWETTRQPRRSVPGLHAQLDGRRPSLVVCCGYYTRAVLVAWN
jgi:hypothetical protein